MILVINVCSEQLHYLEFVKPIEDILKKADETFFTRHYTEVKEEDLERAKKVIICGTSLKDFGYVGYPCLHQFEWIRTFEKPILGICAGMQIINLMFHNEKLPKGMYRKKRSRKSPKDFIHKQVQIGPVEETFTKEFLGVNGLKEVYYLHRYGVIFEKNFELYTHSGIHNGHHTAVKHIEKPIYGVLFHPEVRNKEMIEVFAKL